MAGIGWSDPTCMMGKVDSVVVDMWLHSIVSKVELGTRLDSSHCRIHVPAQLNCVLGL